MKLYFLSFFSWRLCEYFVVLKLSVQWPIQIWVPLISTPRPNQPLFSVLQQETKRVMDLQLKSGGFKVCFSVFQHKYIGTALITRAQKQHSQYLQCFNQVLCWLAVWEYTLLKGQGGYKFILFSNISKFCSISSIFIEEKSR